ncbi:MAG: hypothetical protein J6R90_01670 [Alistipes sp.]|jgi:hypothetical protein|nr:hypothetical protein [Alistipes sp.]
MKKIFSFAVLFAAMSLVACGGEQPKAEEAEEVAVEEVVVEEAPAVAPVVKAEKVELSEGTKEEPKVSEATVTTGKLTIATDEKKSEFQVAKAPVKAIKDEAVVKAPITNLKAKEETKAEEPKPITIGEGSSLKVGGTLTPVKK